MSWEIEKAGRAVVVRMNSGPVNVMDEGFFRDLQDAFDALEREHPESPVVLASAGRAFSAGLDLKYHLSLFRRGDEEEIRLWNERFRDALLRVFSCPRPVVAAVGGHAIAGGLILALCCDYRICVSSGAKFGLNELAIGVPVPCAVAQIVTHALGEPAARRALATGAVCGPEEAVKLGFFDETCEADGLLSRCVDFAQRFGPDALCGYAFSKRALRAEAAANIERVCASVDADLPRALASPAVVRSLETALESLEKRKRPPREEKR